MINLILKTIITLDERLKFCYYINVINKCAGIV